MKGGGQQPVASPETTFFFLGLMIVGLLAMAWFYHHAEIAQFFLLPGVMSLHYFMRFSIQSTIFCRFKH